MGGALIGDFPEVARDKRIAVVTVDDHDVTQLTSEGKKLVSRWSKNGVTFEPFKHKDENGLDLERALFQATITSYVFPGLKTEIDAFDQFSIAEDCVKEVNNFNPKISWLPGKGISVSFPTENNVFVFKEAKKKFSEYKKALDSRIKKYIEIRRIRTFYDSAIYYVPKPTRCYKARPKRKP